MNRQRKTLHKDGKSRFILGYYLRCLKNKMTDFQNVLRKCKKKKREEYIDEIDKIWRKKREMNEDGKEELIGVIVTAAAALCHRVC